MKQSICYWGEWGKGCEHFLGSSELVLTPPPIRGAISLAQATLLRGKRSQNKCETLLFLQFPPAHIMHKLQSRGGREKRVRERFLFVVWVKLLVFKKIQENRGNIWNICEMASLSHSQQIISTILVQSDNQKQWDHGSNQASQTIPRLNFSLPALPPTIHPQNLTLSQVSPLRAEILSWQLSPPTSLHPGIKAR